MADYATLQADLTDLIKDSGVSAAKIRSFIELGENKIQADLMSSKLGSGIPRDMLIRLEDTTATDGSYVLPTDYKRANSVRIGSYIARFAPASKVPPAQEGFADSAIVLDYWQRLPTLSDTNTTNWLLTKQYNAYLYGCALHYASYGQDPALLPLWSEFYNDAIREVKNTDRRQPLGARRTANAIYGAYYTVIGNTMYFARAT